jgi:hypothetical protein
MPVSDDLPVCEPVNDPYGADRNIPVGGDYVGDILEFYGIDPDQTALFNMAKDRFGKVAVFVHSPDRVQIEFTSEYDGVTAEEGSSLAECLARAIAWHLYLDSK